MPNNLTIGERLKVAQPQPLLRASKASDRIYQRLPTVEQQIRQVLRLDSVGFDKRLTITERADARFLNEETLVYFLRTAIRVGEFDFADALAAVLFRRAEKSVRGRVGKLFANAAVAADCAADALGELFGELYAADAARADFAEVRFGLFLKRIVNRSANKYLKRQLVENDFEFLDHAIEAESAPAEIAAAAELSSFDRYDLKKALELLPEPVRTAFVLRHQFGLQIESKDKDETTIARYFGKTERTIRSWLKRADEILEKLREK